MRKQSVKEKRPLSKRALRRQKMEEMRRKQLETAYQYPFCRRCKEKLDPVWVRKLKKQGSIPLCEKCYPIMMEMYKKTIELWSKFRAR